MAVYDGATELGRIRAPARVKDWEGTARAWRNRIRTGGVERERARREAEEAESEA